MSHRCIFCNHKFHKSQAEREIINDVTFYRCPNKDEDEAGRILCGKRLPLNFFNSDSTVISLVGSTNVGKTYFLVALMINLIYNKSLAKLGIQGDLVGEESVNKAVLELIEQAAKGIKLDATAIGAASTAVLEISLTKGNKVRYIYLSLNDNPGEVFKSVDKMIDNLSNVFETNGIIFLVEPKQLPNYQQLLTKEYPDTSNTEPVELYTVVNNTIQLLSYIKKNKNTNNTEVSGRDIWNMIKGLNQQKKSKLPVAFVVSKFDQISSHFHNEIPDDAQHLEDYILLNNKFNSNFFNEISNEFKDIIGNEDDGDPRVLNLLNSSKFPYSFLGCSSGILEDDNFIFKPQGVSLPLIWILKELNKL